jgi:hypothetical protein
MKVEYGFYILICKEDNPLLNEKTAPHERAVFSEPNNIEYLG